MLEAGGAVLRARTQQLTTPNTSSQQQQMERLKAASAQAQEKRKAERAKAFVPPKEAPVKGGAGEDGEKKKKKKKDKDKKDKVERIDVDALKAKLGSSGKVCGRKRARLELNNAHPPHPRTPNLNETFQFTEAQDR